MDNRMFQGKCYVNGRGMEYMNEYDQMDHYSRRLMQQSIYNGCAACADQFAREIQGHEVRRPYFKGVCILHQRIEEELGTEKVYGKDHPQVGVPYTPIVAKRRKTRRR